MTGAGGGVGVGVGVGARGGGVSQSGFDSNVTTVKHRRRNSALIFWGKRLDRGLCSRKGRGEGGGGKEGKGGSYRNKIPFTSDRDVSGTRGRRCQSLPRESRLIHQHVRHVRTAYRHLHDGNDVTCSRQMSFEATR